MTLPDSIRHALMIADRAHFASGGSTPPDQGAASWLSPAGNSLAQQMLAAGVPASVVYAQTGWKPNLEPGYSSALQYEPQVSQPSFAPQSAPAMAAGGSVDHALMLADAAQRQRFGAGGMPMLLPPYAQRPHFDDGGDAGGGGDSSGGDSSSSDGGFGGGDAGIGGAVGYGGVNGMGFGSSVGVADGGFSNANIGSGSISGVGVNNAAANNASSSSFGSGLSETVGAAGLSGAYSGNSAQATGDTNGVNPGFSGSYGSIGVSPGSVGTAFGSGMPSAASPSSGVMGSGFSSDPMSGTSMTSGFSAPTTPVGMMDGSSYSVGTPTTGEFSGAATSPAANASIGDSYNSGYGAFGSPFGFNASQPASSTPSGPFGSFNPGAFAPTDASYTSITGPNTMAAPGFAGFGTDVGVGFSPSSAIGMGTATPTGFSPDGITAPAASLQSYDPSLAQAAPGMNAAMAGITSMPSFAGTSMAGGFSPATSDGAFASGFNPATGTPDNPGVASGMFASPDTDGQMVAVGEQYESALNGQMMTMGPKGIGTPVSSGFASPASSPPGVSLASADPNAPDPNRPGYTNDGTPLGGDAVSATPVGPAPSASASSTDPNAPDPHHPGFTNDGTPLGDSASADPTQPGGLPPAPSLPSDDDTPSKTLSVPTGVTNTAADIAMGALGPLGLIGAAGNIASGYFGGPTIGGALNTALSHPGAPSQVTGSAAGGGSGWPISPSTGGNPIPPGMGSSDGSSDSSAAPAAAPAATTAMQAYLTALQNNPVYAPRGRIQPIYLPTSPPGVAASAPYNPMTDPVVLRALGLAA